MERLVEYYPMNEKMLIVLIKNPTCILLGSELVNGFRWDYFVA